MKYLLTTIFVLALAGILSTNAYAWCLWEDLECCLDRAAANPTKEGVNLAAGLCRAKYRKPPKKETQEYIQCRKSVRGKLYLACLKEHPEQPSEQPSKGLTREEYCDFATPIYTFSSVPGCNMPQYIK